MHKLYRNVGKTRARQVVCTVSAAALMLGVSEAATIGFNFQCNYNGLSGSYSGAYVTAPAFGIGTNAWESLTQMGTGYSTANNSPIMEIVDTTTSSGGLNPLPNGSLNVTWSAYTANVSGFGGYQSSPPNYTYGGNGHQPGEQEVYWGFLRDGVNFGPGSSGGNNNQPGYSIDITGLNSVFTNTPFVIQLIASADSMQDLTNAFIITPANSTTQSVVYPSTPPVANVGDTAWIRGIGGGLSTVSGSLNKDEVMIVGNRAAHAGNPGGYNHASTIAGFIITDKPVVTMSPQPVLAGPNDMITLSAYAIGVPPLFYQWYRNGVGLHGATNSSFVISNLSPVVAGSYVLIVSNQYSSATSHVATVTEDKISMAFGTNFVADDNPSNTPRVGVDHGAAWIASSSDGTKTRSGVMQFVATNANLIVVPGTTNFDVSSGTVMFWMRSAGTDTSTTGGTGAALFGRPTGTSGSDFVVVQSDTGNLIFNSDSGTANAFTSSGAVSDNKWHLIALTFDQTAGGGVALYIDGVLDTTNANTKSWSAAVGKEIEIGYSGDAYWRPYNGLLDDVRFYSRQLTATEITSVFNTGSLVDTASLQMQLNFNSAPGSGFALSWLLSGAVLQSAGAVQGPYVDVPAAPSPFNVTSKTGQKFYRYRFTHQVLMSNPYLM